MVYRPSSSERGLSGVCDPSQLLTLLLLVLISILELRRHLSLVTGRTGTVGVLFGFLLGSSLACLWFSVLSVEVEVVVFIEVPLHDCCGGEQVGSTLLDLPACVCFARLCCMRWCCCLFLNCCCF